MGSAVVDSNNILQFKLSSTCSIYSGELYSIMQALIHIRTQKIQKSVIITDSLSALHTIEQLYTSNPISILIKEQLHLLKNTMQQVSFIWVPSHIGLQGNEKADFHAREAIHSASSVLVNLVPVSDYKPFLKEKVLNKWENEWNLSQSSLHTIKPSIEPWCEIDLNRQLFVKLNRLRIGHSRLTHSYLISKSNRPICDLCNCDINVTHILIECPKYLNERQKHSIPLNIKAALGSHCKLTHLFNYLKDINVLNKL